MADLGSRTRVADRSVVVGPPDEPVISHDAANGHRRAFADKTVGPTSSRPIDSCSPLLQRQFLSVVGTTNHKIYYT
eukprot:scaffold13277_cov114-Isochrysis_galbana.AAC.12